METETRNVEMLRQRCKPAVLPAIQHHLRLYTNCIACPLGTHVMCNNHVFFRGFVPAEVLFIGEAPGESEDTLGLPFVGTSGRILNRIIYESFCHVWPQKFWTDFTWCVTNIVSCIPHKENATTDANSNIRIPTADEAKACRPRLLSFIHYVQPRIIVMLGKCAEKFTPRDVTLSTFPPTLASIRGQESLPTWKPEYVFINHPAYMSRQKDEDLEIRRAVLLLANAYSKYLVS